MGSEGGKGREFYSSVGPVCAYLPPFSRPSFLLLCQIGFIDKTGLLFVRVPCALYHHWIAFTFFCCEICFPFAALILVLFGVIIFFFIICFILLV